MGEPVHVGVQVALQVFGADRVVNAVDAPLGIAPEAFDIVGMGASCNVLLGAAGDLAVVRIRSQRRVMER